MDQQVQVALQRDSPDWRLKHACPACTYKLKDEQPLLFKMLYTFDGNDSLRRIIKRQPAKDDDDTPGPSAELPSSRQVHGDRYLSREYVDKWAAGVLHNMMGDESPTVSTKRLLYCFTDKIYIYRMIVTTTRVLTDGRI